jgi:hypothetical protein
MELTMASVRTGAVAAVEEEAAVNKAMVVEEAADKAMMGAKKAPKFSPTLLVWRELHQYIQWRVF